MIKIYYADISCLEVSDLVFNKLSSQRKTKVNKIKSYNGKKIAGSMDFAEILLDETMTAVVPGGPFGHLHQA